MITITCPWCEEDEASTLATLRDPHTSFTCPDCGTTITFDEEAVDDLDRAA